MLYFDDSSLVIYPAEDVSSIELNAVYARIHISNVGLNGDKDCIGSNRSAFFKEYTIKSLKDRNAVLIELRSVRELLENLKVLIDLDFDASFKLVQMHDENRNKVQMLEIAGKNSCS